jgi:hypothetical protein
VLDLARLALVPAGQIEPSPTMDMMNAAGTLLGEFLYEQAVATHTQHSLALSLHSVYLKRIAVTLGLL